MRLGPVFERELLVTARRPRSFALRFVYGLALLALLASTCRKGGELASISGTIPLAGLSGVARDLFQGLLLAQGVAIVFLTPALVSGAIAGEVQRKTLHDLLTSDLTSAEIVLGKLAARLLHVVVLLAIGLPVLILAGLFGGLDPWLTVGALAASLSTAYFLGALSILGSTQTRSARGALNFTMTLTLTWLILPGAAVVLMPRSGWLGFLLYDWLRPINDWVASSSPFFLWVSGLGGTVRTADAWLERIAWMAGLQLLYGTLLALLAIRCLRATYRGREGRPSRRRGTASAAVEPRPGRMVARPACGDDPMLWKEIFAPRLPAFQRPLGAFVVFVLGILLAWTTYDFASPAFRELAAAGYGYAPSGSARALFHVYLRIVGVGVYLGFVLGVASDAGAGLAAEREKDTWISLVSTPLTGTEIIRAKTLGAIWGIRHTAAILLALSLVGVLAGSLHPLGLAAVLIELAILTWFAAALGTSVSLRSEQTMGAVAKSTGLLVAANVGLLLVTLPLFGARPIAFVGCSPFLVAASLVSYGDVGGTFSQSTLGMLSDSALSSMWVNQQGELMLTLLLGAGGYALGAWWLTHAACRGFDAALDRPALAAAARDDASAHLPPRPHVGGHGPRKLVAGNRRPGPSSGPAL